MLIIDVTQNMRHIYRDRELYTGSWNSVYTCKVYIPG